MFLKRPCGLQPYVEAIQHCIFGVAKVIYAPPVLMPLPTRYNDGSTFETEAPLPQRRLCVQSISVRLGAEEQKGHG